MKTVEVQVPLRSAPAAVYETMLCPDILRAFHGTGTHVGPWQEDTRSVCFDVDPTGSPINVGKHVRTKVSQKKDDATYTVKNRMRLQGLNILSIDSVWHVDEETLKGKAQIRVHVPPPFSWIAERFVATKATHQMDQFARAVVDLAPTS